MQPFEQGVRPILEMLREKGVTAIVIGGVAAVALGVPYTTFDVDIVYDSDPANVERLIGALRTVS